MLLILRYLRPLYSQAIFAIAVLFFLPLLSNANSSTTVEIRFPAPSASRINHDSYFIGLLEKALAASNQENSQITYRLNPIQGQMNQQRILSNLSREERVDVMWSVIDNDRERTLRPVRIPLLKGLIGYRALLIRKGDQLRFSHINSIADLQVFTAGQSVFWPDTKILRHNNLPVTTSSYYEYLFKMLEEKRFDYFPRGVNEVITEVQLHPELEIEANLLLSYPSAMYFFVAPDNSHLADRLERGLNTMINNGEFDAFFYQHPAIKRMLHELNIQNRTIIKLENPLLPQSVPLDIPKYWLHPAAKE